MRIAIVNDKMRSLDALWHIVSNQGIEIAWIARGGDEAVARCAADTPDLILMELNMPLQDGVETTRRIMTDSPCAIVITTDDTEKHAPKTLEAMRAGALDVMKTPTINSNGEYEGEEVVLKKIATVGKLVRKSGSEGTIPKPATRRPAVVTNLPILIAIGASTGGPAALEKILTDIPADFNAAVVIVQHVDVRFSESMADTLGRRSALKLEVAREGRRPEAGTVMIAATNDHLILTPARKLSYTPDPLETPFRPSIDVFFDSVNMHWPGEAIAVLLTGMGRDGARGMQTLRESGRHTIAQDEGSSVVYGMPKAAASIGAATDILPIDKIAPRLIKLVRNGHGLMKE